MHLVVGNLVHFSIRHCGYGQRCRTGSGLRRNRGARCLSIGSPNLNAFAERWVRLVKKECQTLLLFAEVSLERALTEFTSHYHSERPHQAKGNVLLFPPAQGAIAGASRSYVEKGLPACSSTTPAQHE
jgi:transposase InsO family protein